MASMTVYSSHVVLFGKGHFLSISFLICSDHLCAQSDEVTEQKSILKSKFKCSYGATFRMGVLLPNYPEENIVRGENVPNFKVNTSEGTSSNVFQILQDL